jgi:hypothetical protein
MGCMGVLLVRLVVFLVRTGESTPAIWWGVGVGAVVGLILSLVKADWFPVLAGSMLGLVGGLVFEFVLMIARRRRRR